MFFQFENLWNLMSNDYTKVADVEAINALVPCCHIFYNSGGAVYLETNNIYSNN